MRARKISKEWRREWYRKNRLRVLARVKAKRLANIEQARERERKLYPRRLDLILKRKYGIDREEYNKMLHKQGGVCAICKKPCTCGRKLAVDHDHKTGKVRALLCSRCNRGIGLFMGSQEYLEAATNYMKFHCGSEQAFPYFKISE